MKNLLLRLGILGIGFIIGGIVILAGNAADKKSIAKGVGDINNMSISDFAAGDFVEGDIGILCDEFAYLSEYNSTFGIKSNERVSKHYYVVPLVGNTSEYDQFIAIEVGNEDMVSIAETMIDEFWSYAEDNDVSKLVTTMPFRGKVV
ncbi:MAG: hypothetical protein ILP19_06085, partial [Oscillospiraceae bacterium]|nr:hypothetical protein [Oscillospiraceae bacterium]